MKNRSHSKLIKDFKPICVRFVKETKKGLKYELGDLDAPDFYLLDTYL